MSIETRFFGRFLDSDPLFALRYYNLLFEIRGGWYLRWIMWLRDEVRKLHEGCSKEYAIGPATWILAMISGPKLRPK